MKMARGLAGLLLPTLLSGCPTRTIYYPDGGAGGESAGVGGKGSAGSAGAGALGGPGAAGNGGLATGGITGNGGIAGTGDVTGTGGGTGGIAGTGGTSGAGGSGTGWSGGMAGGSGGRATGGVTGSGGVAGGGGHATGGAPGTGGMAGGGGSPATCSSTQTACPSGCANVSNDQTNCGRCGHSCLGGMCSNGACLPVTLAHLATTGATGLALNSTTVFTTVTSNGTTPWSLYAVPKSATNTTPSAILTRRAGDSSTGFLGASDTTLYGESGYTSQGGSVFTAFSCNPNNCSNTVLDWYTTTSDPTACDPSTQECFDETGAGTSSTIQFAKQGTASQTSLQNFSPVLSMASGAIAASGGFVYTAGYYAANSSSPTNSVVQRASEDGTGGVSTLANLGLGSLVAFDTPIIVTPTRVYAVAGDISANTTGLISLSLPNGVGNSAPAFLPGTVVSTNSWITAWGDDTAVYFANNAGQWVMCPAAGCAGTPTVMADATAAEPYLEGDAQAIYWINVSSDPTSGHATGFSLMKLAR